MLNLSNNRFVFQILFQNQFEVRAVWFVCIPFFTLGLVSTASTTYIPVFSSIFWKPFTDLSREILRLLCNVGVNSNLLFLWFVKGIWYPSIFTICVRPSDRLHCFHLVDPSQVLFHEHLPCCDRLKICGGGIADGARLQPVARCLKWNGLFLGIPDSFHWRISRQGKC